MENAQGLMELSRKYNANLFQLTDFDASGLLISDKAPDIPRVGIDLMTVNQLELGYLDVSEEYEPHKKHLKALSPRQKRLVEYRRIEIDSVLAEVGPEKLWEYIETRMIEIAPVRDLTRSIELTINPPSGLLRPINKLLNYVKSRGKTMLQTKEEELRTWEGGFIDVEEMEEKCNKEITESIAGEEIVDSLVEELNNLIDGHEEIH